MVRHLARLVAVLVVVSLLSLLAGPAQAAGLWRIHDSRGDARPAVDIKKTTLDTRPRGYYRVRIYGYEFLRTRLNEVEVYFDARSVNAGPEWALSWGLPNDGVDENGDGNDYRAGLRRVDTWRDAGTTVRCAGIRLGVNLKLDKVTIKIPRRCMGNPGRIRWNVEARRITRMTDARYWYYYDASPRHYRFQSRWVAKTS